MPPTPMNLLTHLINDWIPINAERAAWIDDGEIVDFAVYEIMYSEVRNAYRLKCSGFHPKKHKHYPKVVVDFYKVYQECMNKTKIIAEVQEILNGVR